MKLEKESYKEYINKKIKDVHYPNREDFEFKDYYIEQLCFWYSTLSHGSMKESKREELKLRKELLDSIYKFYKDNE